jgi:spectinomycin phosphotransferase/16S rRNA (guanine(1405)-N(7))-methyltransferase
VRTPPEDLSEGTLRAALAGGWAVAGAAMTYRPVGFGSHHWEAVDTAGTRWFVTVDDLDTKRHTRRESLDDAFGRLRASLGAACDLRDHGVACVVAPVPTPGGDPLVRTGRFAVALYPFVEGRSFAWGQFPTPEHRQAALDLVLAVHTGPEPARRRALPDRFEIPHRDELEAALDEAAGRRWGRRGPYAEPAARLVAAHAAPLRRLLARYDGLAEAVRATAPSRAVLTHGEPHPGNTMLTDRGWVLIDWDTALVAPPERDLWSLDPGDGSVLAAYTAETGVVPLAPALELYRVRWDLADIAVEVGRFRRPHTGTADDAAGWDVLRCGVAALAPDESRAAEAEARSRSAHGD